MSKTKAPSNLELQALHVLWTEGPSTVTTVLENLPDGKSRAYTTVLSVLQSLQRKGLVKTKKAGRAYIYRASLSEASILKPEAQEFVTNLFGGSVGKAILQILNSGNLTEDEKSEVVTALKTHKTKKRAAKKVKNEVIVSKTAAKKKKAAPKKKVAKKAPAKAAPKKTKAAPKKAAKKAPAKAAPKKAKVAKKKAVKKAAPKKAVKKATPKKAAPKKKAAKKAVAKKTPKKKAAKKTARKK